MVDGKREVTDGAFIIPSIFVALWIGWPLHIIAKELSRLRELAERGRR